jgi:prepilin-type N-terminal cleavage/methylation domain-containing protein
MERQRGYSLVEVLIALALIGIVVVAFLSALATSSRALILADERTTAESIARSEIEYVKKSAYDAANNPPQYSRDPSLDIPSGYEVKITAQRLDPEGDGAADDDGIQRITVEVRHQGRLVLASSDYKVNR